MWPSSKIGSSERSTAAATTSSSRCDTTAPSPPCAYLQHCPLLSPQDAICHTNGHLPSSTHVCHGMQGHCYCCKAPTWRQINLIDALLSTGMLRDVGFEGREEAKYVMSPAQLGPQVVHIDLYLLQRLPVERLQPYALHQPLHPYPCDACHDRSSSKSHSRPMN